MRLFVVFILFWVFSFFFSLLKKKRIKRVFKCGEEEVDLTGKAFYPTEKEGVNHFKTVSRELSWRPTLGRWLEERLLKLSSTIKGHVPHYVTCL